MEKSKLFYTNYKHHTSELITEQEASELQKSINLYIQYFEHKDTIQELRNEGISVAIGLPFKLDQYHKEDIQTFIIKKFGVPLGASSHSKDRVTSKTRISYADTNDQLASITFVSEEGTIVESQRKPDNSWATSLYSPKQKQPSLVSSQGDLASLTDQMFFSLRDIYHSYVPLSANEVSYRDGIYEIATFKSLRFTQPRAALFPGKIVNN